MTFFEVKTYDLLTTKPLDLAVLLYYYRHEQRTAYECRAWIEKIFRISVGNPTIYGVSQRLTDNGLLDKNVTYHGRKKITLFNITKKGHVFLQRSVAPLSPLMTVVDAIRKTHVLHPKQKEASL
jgi:DNA-binding PadR family transcriptional regulator